MSTEEIRNEVVEEESTEAKTEHEVEEPTLQELKAEMAKLKRNLNKASAEAADYKKKYRDTLSAQEIAEVEKKEAEARDREEKDALRRELSLMKLEKAYLGMGFTADEAQRISLAEVDNETDKRMKILEEVDARKKKAYEAEFYKNRPEISTGSGDSGADDLFIRGFNSVKPNF